jgi:hypothetical protein
MTEQQFAYWLQGFAELNPQPPTAEQWQSIREHLATVFKKVTPEVQNRQMALDSIKNNGLQDYLDRQKQSQNPYVPKAPDQPYYLGQPGGIIC